MRELLDIVASREAIATLAILGALLATYGTYAEARNSRTSHRWARLFLSSGYVMAGLSVLAFIVAGFVADS